MSIICFVIIISLLLSLSIYLSVFIYLRSGFKDLFIFRSILWKFPSESDTTTYWPFAIVHRASPIVFKTYIAFKAMATVKSQWIAMVLKSKVTTVIANANKFGCIFLNLYSEFRALVLSVCLYMCVQIFPRNFEFWPHFHVAIHTHARRTHKTQQRNGTEGTFCTRGVFLVIPTRSAPQSRQHHFGMWPNWIDLRCRQKFFIFRGKKKLFEFAHVEWEKTM